MSALKLSLATFAMALFAGPAFAQDNSVQYSDDVGIDEIIDVQTDLGAGVQSGDDVEAQRWMRVRCLSRFGEYRECRVGRFARIQQARLQRQFSYRPCIAYQTWGATQRYVWVRNGCQGDFLVFVRGGGGGGWPPGRGGPGRP